MPRTESEPMNSIKIEVNRGCGWMVRVEGEAEMTADALAGSLAAYALQYPHRAFLDGVLVAEAAKGGKVTRV